MTALGFARQAAAIRTALLPEQLFELFSIYVSSPWDPTGGSTVNPQQGVQQTLTEIYHALINKC